MAVKPGKHQKSKQRCKDLCWKVHDRAHIFCFELIQYTQAWVTELLISSLVSSKQLLCFVHGQGQKHERKHTTKNFVEFHNHFFLLTMRRLSFSCKDVSDILSQNLINICCLESMKHIQTKLPLVCYHKKSDLHAPICFASNVTV